MRLVNIQNLTLDYSGLAKIEPHNYLEICRYFANQIMELPTINPDDLVKHGEWLMKESGRGVCSRCHRLDVIDPLATHCRYCGAKMDGGKRENEHDERSR